MSEVGVRDWCYGGLCVSVLEVGVRGWRCDHYRKMDVSVRGGCDRLVCWLIKRLCVSVLLDR